jgi:FkbM family methyltransferase
MQFLRRTARRILYRLPATFRTELRALWHALLLATDRFHCAEPEWARLTEWTRPGATAIDVGADVGYYTSRLSQLVGPTGHIVAIEPQHESFCALARNSRRFRYRNVTLLNVAASDTHSFRRMSLPRDEPGLARLDEQGVQPCLALTIDSLAIPGPVCLVKIDVEGHELHVLRGMRELLHRDRPVVVFEARPGVGTLLAGFGYTVCVDRDRPSPNLVAIPPGFLPGSGLLRATESSARPTQH